MRLYYTTLMIDKVMRELSKYFKEKRKRFYDAMNEITSAVKV